MRVRTLVEYSINGVYRPNRRPHRSNPHWLPVPRDNFALCREYLALASVDERGSELYVKSKILDNTKTRCIRLHRLVDEQWLHALYVHHFSV